jgi:polar amino acid transport system substrate-binding protein
MRRYIALVLMALTLASAALTGCGALASGDKSWDKVKEKGEFVLGLDESFPPMGFKDENNNITGFDIDVATEVCSRLGIKLVPQPINWDTKEEELNSGKIDCIWNGFTITEDRKANILFSKPYMDNRQVLVVKKDSTLSKLSDFAGKKLALQASSSAADALNASEDFKSKLGEVVELDDNMNALMDLEKGGVDAVLMDEIVANYNIIAKKADYKVLDEALASEKYGVGFRKGEQALCDAVWKAMKELKEDGTVAEISTKWFGEDVTTIK